VLHYLLLPISNRRKPFLRDTGRLVPDDVCGGMTGQQATPSLSVIGALFGHGTMSDLSPLSAPRRTSAGRSGRGAAIVPQAGLRFLCMGLFSRFFVRALPRTAEGGAMPGPGDEIVRLGRSRDLARAQPHAGAQKLLRIDSFAVDPGFVMQMRAGGAAG
jgi:hypothetical protein